MVSARSVVSPPVFASKSLSSIHAEGAWVLCHGPVTVKSLFFPRYSLAIVWPACSRRRSPPSLHVWGRAEVAAVGGDDPAVGEEGAAAAMRAWQAHTECLRGRAGRPYRH